MKKLFLLPLFAVLALLVSCSSEGSDDPVVDPVDYKTSVDYYGVLTVGETADTVRCTVVYDVESNVADITVYAMQLDETKPAVNMRMAGIACRTTSTDILFASANPVTPEVSVSVPAGAPSQPGDFDPQYTMEGFSGIIKDNVMEFSAAMPMGDVEFHGVVVPVFAGSMNVLATGAEKYFTMDEIVCEVEVEDGGSLANLCIYGAKFAEGMPMSIDIKLPGVQCRQFNGGYSIAVSDSVVPLVKVAGADYVAAPAYTFTKVEGEVRDAGTMYFNASMTRGFFSYEGERFIRIINK